MQKRFISIAVAGFLLGSTTTVAASQLGIGSATAGTIRGCVGILGIVRIVPDGVNCVTSTDPRRTETPISWTQGGPSGAIGDVDPTGPQTKITHATIKKVTEDIESLSFNTAISQMMIFVNAFTNAKALPLSAMRTFLVLLNPFAPHLTSELWERLNAKFRDDLRDITEQEWPGYDQRFLVEDDVEIAIQVNGKVRDRMRMSTSATHNEIKTAALANPKIQKFTTGKVVRNVVVVPKRLVNIVV